MLKPDEISHYINQLPFDLKAETLVAVLAEKRITLEEVVAVFEGQLKRVWSRDVAWANIDKFDLGDEVLSIHLNRDGTYDYLPEAIFHSESANEDQSGEEMARDSMKLRAEEREAREFFQPFDNEIFLQRVRLAAKENQLFKSIFSEFLPGIVPYFWKVPNDLPENYLYRLKKLFPLIHEITGDLNLTGQCLEYIIQEKVNVSSDDKQNDDLANEDLNYSGILGESLLGIDTISGGHVEGFIKRYFFNIGPVINTETIEFIKNGVLNRFLDCFYGFFIPFEFDVEAKYLFETEHSLMKLGDRTDAEISYLGYNSVLQ